jgi:hypothetical protein
LVGCEALLSLFKLATNPGKDPTGLGPLNESTKGYSIWSLVVAYLFKTASYRVWKHLNNRYDVSIFGQI